MTSKHGPNRRFGSSDNKTVEGIKHFNNPLEIQDYVREHGNIKIQGQQPKEFLWLYTNWMKTLDTPTNEKWTKKLQNWTRAHPELAIDYLLEVSQTILDATDELDDIKDVLFFTIKRMGVNHLFKRSSFQIKVNRWKK